MATSSSAWRLLAETTRFGAHVAKYQHTCGLRVCVAAVSGPLVHGYFTVATEAHDDDGLPHTLEHLVFLGSQRYPYKGLLDKMANRCFAQGTNAWTDTDHTCYTLTTAGRDGFLNLLPIYLDHILFATCSPSGFVTEVHHVDGDGKDAGVVYCEMQSRENTQEDLTSRELLRAFFPPGCGYRSETGGLVHNLRTTCTHAKVAQYHKDFYRAENLCVMVIGDVPAPALFEALQPVVAAIEAEGNKSPFVRPWSNPVPPPSASATVEVRFPCDDETSGDVKMAWPGPAWADFTTREALHVLLDYLTSNAVSPLQAALVQTDEPLCNDVAYSVIENRDMMFIIQCTNVPSPRLKDVATSVKGVLQSLVEADGALDLKFLLDMLEQRRLSILNKAETHPEELFVGAFIGEFLYGTSEDALERALGDMDTLKHLATQPAAFWKSLIKTHFLETPCVSVVGVPDSALAVRAAEAEDQRVQQQRAALGEDGRAACSRDLAAAIAENEKEIPLELVNSLPIPSVANISMHPVNRWTSGVTAPTLPVHTELASLPCFVQADDIDSKFVTISLGAPVPSDPTLLQYLPLYNDMLFEAPVVTKDGTLLAHEAVVEGLAADVVHHSSNLGFNGDAFRPGQLSQIQALSVTVSLENYAKGVEWLSNVFARSQFDKDRIGISRARLLGDATEGLRDGVTVARGMTKNALFRECPSATLNICGIQRQLRLLQSLGAFFGGRDEEEDEEEEEGEEDEDEENEGQDSDDGESEVTDATGGSKDTGDGVQPMSVGESGDDAAAQAVVDALHALRNALVASSQLKLHIAGPLSKIPNITAPLREFLPLNPATPAALVPFPWSYQQRVINTQWSQVISLGSVESGYLMQCAQCFHGIAHPDLAALTVLCEYLTATEGPMWRQIRGQGLSYNFFLRHNMEEGMLYFGLFQSTQLVAAYDMARSIVAEYCSGTATFETTALDAARAAAIFEVVESEKSPAAAAEESLRTALMGGEGISNAEFLQRLQHVTTSDLQRVLTQHVQPLFDNSKSLCMVCVAPTKIDEVVKGFAERGRVLLRPATLDEAMP